MVRVLPRFNFDALPLLTRFGAGVLSSLEALAPCSASILIQRTSTVSHGSRHIPRLVNAHFAVGNEAPQVSVQALYSADGNDPTETDNRVSGSNIFILG